MTIVERALCKELLQLVVQREKPDKGGKKEDTAIYVLLMQTLRKTFDSGGGRFVLTFTAPSSYCYLKWFDLPDLLRCADWVNLMS